MLHWKKGKPPRESKPDISLWPKTKKAQNSRIELFHKIK
jgi:hypothetical protein